MLSILTLVLSIGATLKEDVDTRKVFHRLTIKIPFLTIFGEIVGDCQIINKEKESYLKRKNGTH